MEHKIATASQKLQNGSKCVFCEELSQDTKLLRKEQLASIILDANPRQPGHLLIISNAHFEAVNDVPDYIYYNMMRLARESAKRAVERLGADGYRIMINAGRAAGQEIAHPHVHVIPRYSKPRGEHAELVSALKKKVGVQSHFSEEDFSKLRQILR